jgi:integrase
LKRIESSVDRDEDEFVFGSFFVIPKRFEVCKVRETHLSEPFASRQAGGMEFRATQIHFVEIRQARGGASPATLGPHDLPEIEGGVSIAAGKQIGPIGDDMNPLRLPPLNDIYEESGTQEIDSLEEAADQNRLDAIEQWRDRSSIGSPSGSDCLTKEELKHVVSNDYPFTPRQSEAAVQSSMTITTFVESAFVPEHVLVKGLASRFYYQAILKYVLQPEEVDRIFHTDHEKSKPKLKAIPDWPYLGDLPIEDCGPDEVQRLISAAHAQGYSAQTVMHIRNVVSIIFSYAKKLRRYHHDNPARAAILPERPQKSSHLLTLSQAKEVLRAMRYPEKQMTMMAMLTSMNVAEICGLQWKHVNLTGTSSGTAGEAIPPITIAVRKRLFRGELDNVSSGRTRNLPIPELLLPMLILLSGRGRWTGPDDFVLVSRAGTPINAINITARRLRTIGNELQMPWLTWHVFRRGHFALEAELGEQLYVHLASIFHSEPQQGPGLVKRA